MWTLLVAISGNVEAFASKWKQRARILGWLPVHVFLETIISAGGVPLHRLQFLQLCVVLDVEPDEMSVNNYIYAGVLGPLTMQILFYTLLTG